MESLIDEFYPSYSVHENQPSYPPFLNQIPKSNQLIVPLLGITGGALATVVSLFALCGIVLFELKRKLPRLALQKAINWTAFVTASIGMIVYIAGVKAIMPPIAGMSRMTLLIWVLIIAVTGGLLYLILLIRLKAFSIPSSPFFALITLKSSFNNDLTKFLISWLSSTTKAIGFVLATVFFDAIAILEPMVWKGMP